MSRIRKYFKPFIKGEKIAWSDDPEKRDNLASDFLGAEIVSSLDHWVDRAIDLLTKRKPKREDDERERAMRKTLSALTKEQREAVARLVARTASGAIFSTLVAFDQGPFFVEITAIDSETEEKVATILPGFLNLHDRHYQWISKFSEDPDRFSPRS